MSLVHGKGVIPITETIKGDFLDQEEQLRARFGAAANVDATCLRFLSQKSTNEYIQKYQNIE